MNQLDLFALAEALPAGTPIVVSGSTLRIGTSFETREDAAPWSDAASGDTPEEAVARAYFEATLQQRMGDAYAAASAAGTLPSWVPGSELPA